MRATEQIFVFRAIALSARLDFVRQIERRKMRKCRRCRKNPSSNFSGARILIIRDNAGGSGSWPRETSIPISRVGCFFFFLFFFVLFCNENISPDAVYTSARVISASTCACRARVSSREAPANVSSTTCYVASEEREKRAHIA